MSDILTIQERLLNKLRTLVIEERNHLVAKPFVLLRPILLIKIRQLDKVLDIIDREIGRVRRADDLRGY